MDDGVVEKRLVRKFFRCVDEGNAQGVKDFLDNGMPVNTVNPCTGATALHHAAACGARAAFRTLNATDEVDHLKRDGKGRLASELADVYGHDLAMAKLLRKKEKAQATALNVPLSRRQRSPRLTVIASNTCP